MGNLSGAIFFLFIFISGCGVSDKKVFPNAKRMVVAREAHGFKWDDAYAHLSNFDSPSVRDYLHQEAVFFDDQVKPLQSLINVLSQELNSYLPQTLSSKRFRQGEFDWHASRSPWTPADSSYLYSCHTTTITTLYLRSRTSAEDCQRY